MTDIESDEDITSTKEKLKDELDNIEDRIQEERKCALYIWEESLMPYISLMANNGVLNELNITNNLEFIRLLVDNSPDYKGLFSKRDDLKKKLKDVE